MPCSFEPLFVFPWSIGVERWSRRKQNEKNKAENVLDFAQHIAAAIVAVGRALVGPRGCGIAPAGTAGTELLIWSAGSGRGSTQFWNFCSRLYRSRMFFATKVSEFYLRFTKLTRSFNDPNSTFNFEVFRITSQVVGWNFRICAKLCCENCIKILRF